MKPYICLKGAESETAAAFNHILHTICLAAKAPPALRAGLYHQVMCGLTTDMMDLSRKDWNIQPGELLFDFLGSLNAEPHKTKEDYNPPVFLMPEKTLHPAAFKTAENENEQSYTL